MDVTEGGGVLSFTINDITKYNTKIYQNKIIKILKKFVVTNIKFVVTNLRIVMSTFLKTTQEAQN